MRRTISKPVLLVIFAGLAALSTAATSAAQDPGALVAPKDEALVVFDEVQTGFGRTGTPSTGNVGGGTPGECDPVVRDEDGELIESFDMQWIAPFGGVTDDLVFLAKPGCRSSPVSSGCGTRRSTASWAFSSR